MRLKIIERVQLPLTRRISDTVRVEMDPVEIWEAFTAACRLLKHAADASAVVLSTLCPSLVALDGSGAVLYPAIIHQDRRSSRQAEYALSKAGPELFMQINGNLPVPGGISLTSLLWIRDNCPDIYRKRGLRFGHICTFMLNRLCGRMLIDPSNASFTGLYDTVGCSGWSEKICGSLDIDPGLLPDISWSADPAGELGREAAAAAGLRPGITVYTGANDTTCAAVGAGAVNPGDLLNTSGTVDILAVCLDAPLVSDQHLLRTHAYPGRWLAMRTVGAGGGSLEWFRENFCREMDRDFFYGEYLTGLLDGRSVNSTKPSDAGGDRGLLPVFDPFLSGDRHSTSGRKGAFRNLSLGSSREDMLLSMLDGICDYQFSALERWGSETELGGRIFHVGGGARPSYTRFKQEKLEGYVLVELGETVLTGAASLAFDIKGNN